VTVQTKFGGLLNKRCQRSIGTLRQDRNGRNSRPISALFVRDPIARLPWRTAERQREGPEIYPERARSGLRSQEADNDLEVFTHLDAVVIVARLQTGADRDCKTARKYQVSGGRFQVDSLIVSHDEGPEGTGEGLGALPLIDLASPDLGMQTLGSFRRSSRLLEGPGLGPGGQVRPVRFAIPFRCPS